MAKYYIRWQTNVQSLPATSEERAKLGMSLAGMVKQDIQGGKMKDWGAVPGEHIGYCLMEVASEVDLATSLAKWWPYIIFEVMPVITVDQYIESIKKMVAEAQTKKK